MEAKVIPVDINPYLQQPDQPEEGPAPSPMVGPSDSTTQARCPPASPLVSSASPRPPPSPLKVLRGGPYTRGAPGSAGAFPPAALEGEAGLSGAAAGQEAAVAAAAHRRTRSGTSLGSSSRASSSNTLDTLAGLARGEGGGAGECATRVRLAEVSGALSAPEGGAAVDGVPMAAGAHLERLHLSGEGSAQPPACSMAEPLTGTQLAGPQ